MNVAVLIVEMLRGQIQDVNDVEAVRFEPGSANASKPDAIEQVPGIGMARRVEEGPGVVELDDAAGLHHRDSVAVMGGDAEIAGDDQLRGPGSRASFCIRSRTWRWMVTSRPAVGSSATSRRGGT